MGITVAQLMEKYSHVFSLELQTGEGGLSNTIQRIGVMETEDFATGSDANGLFVISTLSFAVNNPETLDAVIRLIQAQPAGLAIKTKRFFNEIPAAVLACAEACNVPLFEFTANVPFSRFITDVSKTLAEEELCIDEKIVSKARHLRKYMSSEPLEEILSDLDSTLGTECFFIDVYGSIVTSREAHRNYSVLGGRLLERGISFSHTRERIIEDGTTAFVCRTGNVFLGLLVFVDVGSITEEMEDIIELSLSHVAVRVCEMRISRADGTVESTQNLLNQIMLLEKGDNRMMRNRIRDLGLELLDQYVFVVMAIREELPLCVKSALIEYCEAQLQNRFENIILAEDRSGLRCLITFSAQDNLAQKNAIYNRLSAFRNSALASHSEMIDIGISLVQTDASAMAQGSTQAKNAVSLGRLYRNEKHVYSYSSFVIQGMLHHCTEMQEFKWIEQQIIAPISERDALYDSCLWETISILYQVPSLKEAANKLHIHISTLRYRIQKIKDLTGFDFLNTYGNYVLHTAYLIWLDKQA